jgi:DNA-binding NarL/FixJ family response regulator
LGHLTKTQIKVLQLVAAGKTNAQISEIRETSIEATEALISRIWKVLEIDTNQPGNARVKAARKYLQHAGFSSDFDQ